MEEGRLRTEKEQAEMAERWRDCQEKAQQQFRAFVEGLSTADKDNFNNWLDGDPGEAIEFMIDETYGV